MVLDAFESYLGELLAETMKEEDSMVLGVSEEIRKLNGTLSSLKKFLYIQRREEAHCQQLDLHRTGSGN